MNQPPIKKAFDCIAHKREVQMQIYEEIKDFTVEEQIAYFKKAEETGPLAAWCKSVRQAQTKSSQGQTDWLDHETFTVMAIPNELMSAVRELIAKYQAVSPSHNGVVRYGV